MPNKNFAPVLCPCLDKRSILLALVIALAGMLCSCEPAVDPVRSFTIKEGSHYASERYVETLQSSVLTFEAKFDQSAVYDLHDAAQQSNKNKLLGFSDCNSLHHENSARFAWQWYNDRLEIFAYCYVNSVRVEKFIGVASLNQFENYRIELKEHEYVFYFNNEPPVTVERGNVGDRGVYYMLWPYFGGSLPAPQDVSIEIKMDY